MHADYAGQNPPSKYDYGTDNEDDKSDYAAAASSDQQVFQMKNGGIAAVGPYIDANSTTATSGIEQFTQNEAMRMKVTQTEISQEDFNNFLHKCTLPLPNQLSQKFVRLSKEFNNNIDYIMNYVYRLVGQQQQNGTTTALPFIGQVPSPQTIYPGQQQPTANTQQQQQQ